MPNNTPDDLSARLANLESSVNALTTYRELDDKRFSRLQKSIDNLCKETLKTSGQIAAAAPLLQAVDAALASYGNTARELSNDERDSFVRFSLSMSETESLRLRVQKLERRSSALTGLANDVNAALADFMISRRKNAKG